MAKRRKKGGRRKRVPKAARKAKVQKKQPPAPRSFREAVVQASGWDVHPEIGHKLTRNLTPAERKPPCPLGYTCTAGWDYRDAHARAQQKLWTRENQTRNFRTLYHGTSYENLAAITHLNLRVGPGGRMFGAGIYLTPDMVKALGFARGPEGRKYVLEVRVNLGRVKVMERADHGLGCAPRGYHSVHGKAGHTFTRPPHTLIHNEFVVYDPRQVRVTGLFELRETPWL